MWKVVCQHAACFDSLFARTCTRAARCCLRATYSLTATLLRLSLSSRSQARTSNHKIFRRRTNLSPRERGESWCEMSRVECDRSFLLQRVVCTQRDRIFGVTGLLFFVRRFCSLQPRESGDGGWLRLSRKKNTGSLYLVLSEHRAGRGGREPTL